MQNKVKKLALLFVIACLASSVILTGCSSGGKESSNTSSTNTASNTSTTNTEASSTPEWEAFLDEYDAWVDTYIVFVDKYIENPTNASLISDYAAMSSDISTWASKAGDVEESLSTEDAVKYADRLNAISEKLNAAAQKLLASSGSSQ